MRTRLFTLGVAILVAGVLFAALPSSQASATGRVHCVKYGETLYGIANYYGTTANAIAHHNGLYNPNYVRAGKCLSIPSYGYGHKAPHYGKTYKPGYGHSYKPSYGHAPAKYYPSYGKKHHYGKGRVHCLRYGETLYGLAWRYGVSAWSIAHANGIYNPNYVRAGQCLTIPGY